MNKILTEEQIRKRILNAVKKGNHETRYIIEACHVELQYFAFCKVLAELQKEGLLTYKEHDGYYFAGC